MAAKLRAALTAVVAISGTLGFANLVNAHEHSGALPRAALTLYDDEVRLQRVHGRHYRYRHGHRHYGPRYRPYSPYRYRYGRRYRTYWYYDGYRYRPYRRYY